MTDQIMNLENLKKNEQRRMQIMNRLRQMSDMIAADGKPEIMDVFQFKNEMHKLHAELNEWHINEIRMLLVMGQQLLEEASPWLVDPNSSWPKQRDRWIEKTSAIVNGLIAKNESVEK